MPRPADPPTPGLRERKKARTRDTIHSHALRLFVQRGYDATTVEDILVAAEVSETTLYRYFPTKKDLVLADDLDPLFIAAVQSQPAQLSAIQAIRSALRSVFAGLSAQEWIEQRDRATLILSVPELRAAMLDQFIDTVDMLTEVIAERDGRAPQDPEARTLAGAIIGVGIAAMTPLTDDPITDMAARLDEYLLHLETRLTL